MNYSLKDAVIVLFMHFKEIHLIVIKIAITIKWDNVSPRKIDNFGPATNIPTPDNQITFVEYLV